MFQHISLRPSEAEDAVISTEMQMARKGVGGRIAFALIVAFSSLLWLAPLGAAAYAGTIIVWELVGRPWTTARAVAALRGRRGFLRLYHRCTILFVACLYSTIPLAGILSGQQVGWYLALMAFCSAVISGVTYFSNDKWQFAACTGPSFLIATAAPFVFGVPAPIAMVILLLNAMFAASALQSAVHRGELVESISKEEAARTRAESANIEKSQFIANVSHELRTPLNAIIGYSELMREGAEEDARTSDQGDLDKVLMASKRLLHLVNELLDISKIEAGKLALNVSWFDANEMIAAAAAATGPLAAAAGVTVAAETAPGLGQGISDEFRLSQCVMNLLANAVATAKSGCVTLRARRTTERGVGWFVIEVASAGARFDAAALERLFDPFAQGDEINLSGGTSLGLAITRRVARLLGGDVTADSRPNEGTVFILRTPVVARLSAGPDVAVAPDEASPIPNIA